jgi:hypothetical protein
VLAALFAAHPPQVCDARCAATNRCAVAASWAREAKGSALKMTRPAPGADKIDTVVKTRVSYLVLVASVLGKMALISRFGASDPLFGGLRADGVCDVRD